MSNIVPVQNKEITFSNEEIETVKKTIAKDATEAELALFLGQCKRTALDPFSKQIYFVKDKNGKVTIMTSIDGLRLIAERSEKYEGQTQAQWCGMDGKWTDVWLDNNPPVAAKVGVFKTGFRDALFSVALMKEYQKKYADGNPVKGPWTEMPTIMLAKVAESLALRKAFPNEMSGIYSDAEITFQSTDVKPDSQAAKNVAALSEVIKETSWTDIPSKVVNAIFDREPKEESSNPGDYVVRFGKYKERSVNQMQPEEIEGYIKWLKNSSATSGKAMGAMQKEFIEAGEAYLEKMFSESQPPELQQDEMPF